MKEINIDPALKQSTSIRNISNFLLRMSNGKLDIRCPGIPKELLHKELLSIVSSLGKQDILHLLADLDLLDLKNIFLREITQLVQRFRFEQGNVKTLINTDEDRMKCLLRCSDEIPPPPPPPLIPPSVEITIDKTPVDCPLCKKSFASLSRINSHMKVHSSSRPYKCMICLKDFVRKHHLRDHILAVHQNFRPFKCQDCGKCFGKKSTLDRHEIVHASNVLGKKKDKQIPGCKRILFQDFREIPFSPKRNVNETSLKPNAGLLDYKDFGRNYEELDKINYDFCTTNAKEELDCNKVVPQEIGCMEGYTSVDFTETICYKCKRELPTCAALAEHLMCVHGNHQESFEKGEIGN